MKGVNFESKIRKMEKNLEKEKQEKENMQKDSEDFNLDENTRLIRKNSLRKLKENEEKQKESLKKLEEKIKKRQNETNVKAKKRGIEYGVLDKVFIGSSIGFVGTIFLCFGGFFLSVICPVVGIPLANIGLAGIIPSVLMVSITGTLRENKK